MASRVTRHCLSTTQPVEHMELTRGFARRAPVSLRIESEATVTAELQEQGRFVSLVAVASGAGLGGTAPSGVMGVQHKTNRFS